MTTATRFIESSDYPELGGFDSDTLNQVLAATAGAGEALDVVFAAIDDKATLDRIGLAFQARFKVLVARLAVIDDSIRQRFGLGFSVKLTLKEIVDFDQECAFETKELWTDLRHEASLERLQSQAREALDAYVALVRAKSLREVE